MAYLGAACVWPLRDLQLLEVLCLRKIEPEAWPWQVVLVHRFLSLLSCPGFYVVLNCFHLGGPLILMFLLFDTDSPWKLSLTSSFEDRQKEANVNLQKEPGIFWAGSSGMAGVQHSRGCQWALLRWLILHPINSGCGCGRTRQTSVNMGPSVGLPTSPLDLGNNS